MRDPSGGLDVATLHEVLSRFRSALEEHREELDSLNVYPVPDGDTGTNMLLTQRAVMDELEQLGDQEAGAFAEAVARGSLMGARGNSGVILAQVLRGLTWTTDERDGDAALARALGRAAGEARGGVALADALWRAADEARRAVARPVEGTALTVLGDAAAAARGAAAAGEGRQGVAEAALAEGRRSLRRTAEVLPELRAAGVVDAGALGMVLLLDALASVLSGHEMTVGVGPSGPVGREEVTIAAGLQFRYEVMYLLRGDDSRIPELSDRLDRLGDSVVVVGGDGLYRVHVHTNEPEAAVGSSADVGVVEGVRTVNLESEVAGLCLTGQARAMRVGERQDSALVAVADGDGIAGLFGSLGAMVVRGGSDDQLLAERLTEAIDAAPAGAVMVLLNGADAAAAERAAAMSARAIRVVATRSALEGLSAAASFNPEIPPDELAEQMADAARGVTAGAVTRADHGRSPGAGAPHECDWLGLAHGDVRVTGDDPAEVAFRLVASLRTPDHEILTLLAGADASSEETNRLAATLTERFDDLEIEVHRGDQPDPLYLLGLE